MIKNSKGIVCMIMGVIVAVLMTSPVLASSNLFAGEAAGDLTGYKICVDPGHGGSAPGAVGPTGYEEKTANLDMALRLRDLLETDGATVYMTRTTDVDVSLSERVAIANNNNVDIFVSIHCNAFDGTVQGTETYYHTSLSSTSPAANLSNFVQNELIAHLDRPNRGVKQADFYVLRETTMPATLTEIMFIDNAEEEELLKDPTVRQDAAIAMYHGICEYFGVTPVLTYDIPIFAGWQFVSFPITATGDILTVFDDAAWSSGTTDWDRIYWYDPLDNADHWKSYNKNSAALGLVQDMPPIDNTMGFWININSTGGDNVLTVGSGYDPSGTTINLVAGWNMVGFPSQTEGYTAGDLKADSGGIVTSIERFNAAATPYLMEVMPDADAFVIGQAYWVYSTGVYDWVIP